jgi:hypothetical protein
VSIGAEAGHERRETVDKQTQPNLVTLLLSTRLLREHSGVDRRGMRPTVSISAEEANKRHIGTNPRVACGSGGVLCASPLLLREYINLVSAINGFGTNAGFNEPHAVTISANVPRERERQQPCFRLCKEMEPVEKAQHCKYDHETRGSEEN